jgi:hypothetical protein
MYQNFKTKWINKVIDYDGYYGGQCFDVANQYILEIAGAKPIIALLAAADIWWQPDKIFPDVSKWDRIANTPEFIPEQGDIVVWDKASWNLNYGHVGIIDSSTLDGGVVFQQNGLNPQEGAKLVVWNWHTNNFLGVYRLKKENNNNSMNKANLINEIEKNSVFDQETKSKLINAVTGDDSAYLIAFAGSSPRIEAEQWRRQYEEVNAELETLTVNSQQSTTEKIELTNDEVVDYKNWPFEDLVSKCNTIIDTDTISEASQIIEQGRKEGWSTEQWLMGFVKFGIDKWALLSTVFAAIAQYTATINPEHTRYIWGYAAVLSVIVLVYFLTNKIIDKWTKSK